MRVWYVRWEPPPTYAHWTFNANTATWNASINDGTVNGSGNITTAVSTDPTGAAPSYTPAKTGYNFKGWYTSACGATPVSGTSSQTYGEKLTLPAASTKDGYSFAGWYTPFTRGNQSTASATYSTVGNTTYYAHWITTSSYTMTWDMMGT